MERLKRARAPKRTAFTKAFNTFKEKRDAAAAFKDIEVAFQMLEEKMEDLSLTSNQLLESMYDSENLSEEDIQKEMDESDDYRRKFLEARTSMQELKVQNALQDSDNMSEVTVVRQNTAIKSFKLPKIELVKFSGEVREWLQFWSLFKKIHEDHGMQKEEKFRYLIQAMVPQSRAADLVNSYPPTSINYDKVIASLTSRFGRKDLQIEYYMRELLQLLSQNLIDSGKRKPLSTLYDKIESHLRALDSLGVSTSNFAAVLYPLVESCLPEDLIRVWQRNYSLQVSAQTSEATDETESRDRLVNLIKFLESEVQNELRISMATNRFGFGKNDASRENSFNSKKNNKSGTSAANIPSATNLLSTKKSDNKCLFCDSVDHASENCQKAANMTLEKRQDIAKSKFACLNCLLIGHIFKTCRVKVKCDKCSRRHVTLMCPFPLVKESDNTGKSIQAMNSVQVVSGTSCFASVEDCPTVYLQTLRAKLKNNDKEITVRVIFDGGSQHSYIKKSTVMQMGYKPIGEFKMNHLLFGGFREESVRHKRYAAQLCSMDNNYSCELTVIDSEKICSEVPMLRKGIWCNELENLNIKFTDFDCGESDITVLIGADVGLQFETGRLYHLACGLSAKETLLGWTLSGKLPENKCTNLGIMAISMFTQTFNIESLWTLDVLGIEDPIAHQSKVAQEEIVKSNFLKSVSLNSEGRYEVPLPWKDNHPTLDTNKIIAGQRLQSTLKKLRVDGHYERYNTVFKNWLDAGIIETVPENEIEDWGHYLPHRPVFKENSTTQVRPVFDASAKGKGRPSLNDCLHTGPNLIELVSSVLLRFREGNIGVISDIEKAFLQISIAPEFRDFLRFLWLDEHNNSVVYRHCRVVFGVCSSPFILGAVILMHLKKALSTYANNSSEIAKKYIKIILKLIDSFYVDNCVTSVNTINELNEFIRESKNVMESAKFNLRGWEFNGDKSIVKQSTVLGILWDKSSDTLSLNIENLDKLDLNKLTKRKILSVSHRIFDPLGFATPVTLVSRILLQQTWNKGFSWDQEVDDELKNKFFNWFRELRDLNKVQVPRCLLGDLNQFNNISLHTFCDASQFAYAAVTFLRLQTETSVKISFVQAKSRVSPSREKGTKISIPRLELLAATIGVRLASSILKVLKIENLESYFWTDSSTVLAWIQRDSNWAVFVANRVKEIRESSSPKQWFHVPGDLNPADLPSRGCRVVQLLTSKWWEGPEWLKERNDTWPAQTFLFDEQEINGEMRKAALKVTNKDRSIVTLLTTGKNEDFILERFSEYSKVLKVVAWIKRFSNNARKNSDQCKNTFLTVREIKSSEMSILKFVQSRSFKGVNDEIIQHLEPCVDDKGLIRIKTKIIFREDAYNFRYPIVLPKSDYIVNLIIRNKHEELHHAGIATTMNSLRENFWILGGRKVIRSVIKKCVTCQRHDLKSLTCAPAPLPFNRVRDATIFEVIGLDFAGPIFLKGNKKSWICLFTCAVYRAVHLELVNSLNTPSLLMALRRFIGRRGRPSVAYSDNGTNFKGLDNRFQKIDFEKLAKAAALQQIEWIFSPPAAPWWGGFWECLVGLLKRLLRRTLKKSCLDSEEMTTVLVDCESIINSRPITFLADNDNEIAPLTPSHFLKETKEIGVLDLDKIENCDWNKRYAYRVKLMECFRERFRNEYLGALVQHKNNVNEPSKISIGDLVFIGYDNLKRVEWPLAKVKDLIMGRDGNVRVARLVTADGELVRPLQRLYCLELARKENMLDSFSEINTDDRIIKVLPGKENFSQREENELIDCSEEVTEKPVITRKGRVVKKVQRLSYDK